MNHHRQYQLLIQKAQQRKVDPNEYYEKHHIIPRSHGGTNEKTNLVHLTAREHFVAHMLLARMYGGGMWQAAKMMKNSRGCQKRVINNRLYEIARKKWAEFLKGKKRPAHVGEAIKKARTGKKASENTKAKMSSVRKGRPRAGDPSKWKHTDEAKAKMSVSQKLANAGRRLPDLSGDKNPMKRPEVAAKISAAKKAYWAKIREQNQLNKG